MRDAHGISTGTGHRHDLVYPVVQSAVCATSRRPPPPSQTRLQLCCRPPTTILTPECHLPHTPEYNVHPGAPPHRQDSLGFPAQCGAPSWGRRPRAIEVASGAGLGDRSLRASGCRSGTRAGATHCYRATWSLSRGANMYHHALGTVRCAEKKAGPAVSKLPPHSVRRALAFGNGAGGGKREERSMGVMQGLRANTTPIDIQFPANSVYGRARPATYNTRSAAYVPPRGNIQ